MKLKDLNNYRYYVFVNNFAVVNFLKVNRKIDRIDKLDYQDITLLSYIVTCFNNSEGLKTKNIKGVNYILLCDNFILSNLPFWNTKQRQIKNRIKKLCDFGFILRQTVNFNERYVAVDELLLKIWYKENISITPSEYLKKNNLKLYRSIRSEYDPLLLDINIVLDNFNKSYLKTGKAYNVHAITNKLIPFLKSSINR